MSTYVMQLAELTRAHDQLPRGSRTEYLKRQAERLGVSYSTLRRDMKAKLGVDTGRKTRSDKGRTKADIRAVEIAATLMREGVRKKGKATMPATVSYGVLVQNKLEPGVAIDQFRRVMRARKLDARSQTRAAPHVRMRVPHVNYMHQVDASVCVIYYLKGELRFMDEKRFYKNKPANDASIKKKVLRYTLWEAASGAIKVRYFEGLGETQEQLAEFILWAWSRNTGAPPYGVPLFLYMDPGSANTAYAIKALGKSLGCQIENHLPERANATGGVENAHNIIETHFECLLRGESVHTLEALNAAAEEWQYRYNEDCLPGQDCALRRNGMVIGARANLWRLIREEELRFLPPIEVCRALMAGKTVERPVKNDLTVSYKHPGAVVTRRYSVSGLPGVSAGDTVSVIPLVYPLGECHIRIELPRYDGETLVYTVKPETRYDQFGQNENAAVWFDGYHSHKHTVIDAQGKRLDELAYPNAKGDEALRKARSKNETPLVGVLDGKNLTMHSHLKNLPLTTSMPRRGSTIETPDYATVAPAPPMTHFAACRALAKSLGRALSVEESERVQAWYPDGVREADLATLSTCIESGTTPFNAVRKTGTA